MFAKTKSFIKRHSAKIAGAIASVSLVGQAHMATISSTGVINYTPSDTSAVSTAYTSLGSNMINYVTTFGPYLIALIGAVMVFGLLRSAFKGRF